MPQNYRQSALRRGDVTQSWVLTRRNDPIVGQDSACHRRFRSKAIDWNLRFPVAERYTRARKARRVRYSMKNGGLHGF